MNDLLENIDRLHTTELGEERIRRNLRLETGSVIQWCKARILAPGAAIERRGKNWYITVGDCRITVNAGSYTVITVHRVRR